MNFVDLHCHYIPRVDDGVRSDAEALELLRGLGQLGFVRVVATPHIRPPMFPNHRGPLGQAFEQLKATLASHSGLPAMELASEHFFDDEVFQRLLAGDGIPYSGGRSILIEFAPEALPHSYQARLYNLRQRRLRPVIAHPERYAALWSKPTQTANELRHAGGVLLLDLLSLVGKNGSRAQKAAEALVSARAFYAACSDAHRPEDCANVALALARLARLAGPSEVSRLLVQGPQEILCGSIIDEFD